MNPKLFAEAINKIHQAFYNQTLSVVELHLNEIKLKYDQDHFSVENYIKTRYRITFPDYVGKIDVYRNIFGHIMKNDDNICDTSDFIDLPLSHVKIIYTYIKNIHMDDLKRLKDD